MALVVDRQNQERAYAIWREAARWLRDDDSGMVVAFHSCELHTPPAKGGQSQSPSSSRARLRAEELRSRDLLG